MLVKLWEIRMIFLSIITYGLASIFLKKGALQMPSYTVDNLLVNYYYFLSIFFLIVHAFIWQLVLMNHKLNFDFIYKSFYYPLLLLISYFIFEETISLWNIVGTALIVFGLVMITKKQNLGE